jgi:peptidoglycan/LPS O-acetylase OafA/YrhL
MASPALSPGSSLPAPASSTAAPPPDAHRAFLDKTFFGSLDGLRALSILGVVWHHSARASPHLPLAEEGAMGVPLFFAISGFLITTLLLRERDRRGTISIRNFFARRSLRIFPLYYTVLLAYVIMVAFLERDPGERAEFFHNLRYYATYTSNWFVHLDGRVIFYFAWSLATEEQFYLVWPWLEKVLTRHRAVVVALGLLAASWAAGADRLPIGADSFLRTVLTSLAPAILIGVVLAHLLHDRRGFAALGPWLGRPWASPLLLALVIGLLMLRVSPFLSAMAMTLLVGACVVNERHALAPALRLRAVASIGQVSYGIYLLHMLALNFVERFARAVSVESRAAIFIGTLLAAWAVAVLSFRYYESRFLALKARFAS